MARNQPWCAHACDATASNWSRVEIEPRTFLAHRPEVEPERNATAARHLEHALVVIEALPWRRLLCSCRHSNRCDRDNTPHGFLADLPSQQAPTTPMQRVVILALYVACRSGDVPVCCWSVYWWMPAS